MNPSAGREPVIASRPCGAVRSRPMSLVAQVSTLAHSVPRATAGARSAHGIGSIRTDLKIA